MKQKTQNTDDRIEIIIKKKVVRFQKLPPCKNIPKAIKDEVRK